MKMVMVPPPWLEVPLSLGVVGNNRLDPQYWQRVISAVASSAEKGNGAEQFGQVSEVV
jgi:hypothetical protein